MPVKVKIFELTCQFTFCCYLLPRFLSKNLVWIIFSGIIVQKWVNFNQLHKFNIFLLICSHFVRYALATEALTMDSDHRETGKKWFTACRVWSNCRFRVACQLRCHFLLVSSVWTKTFRPIWSDRETTVSVELPLSVAFSMNDASAEGGWCWNPAAESKLVSRVIGNSYIS